jgi:putative Mn2+ efflux pump MntP
MSSKPGVKTSEWWLSLAALITSALLSSGLVSNSLALQCIGGVATLLTALGYQVSRSFVKTSEKRSEALMEASKMGAGKSPD